jgi:basic amino acid/polyamine antiporter, APA family
VVVAVLAAFVPLDYLIDVVSIGTLTAFVIVSLGVIILRRREPDLKRGFKVPGYPVTPVLSILACAYILSSLRAITWLVFAGWVLVFLAFYVVYGRKHSVVGRLQRGELSLDELPSGEDRH